MICPACGHHTLGDLINARASAGARRVEAEEALRRAKPEEERAAVERLARAIEEEAAAQKAEAAGEQR